MGSRYPLRLGCALLWAPAVMDYPFPHNDSVEFVDRLGGRLSVEQERINMEYDALNAERRALALSEQREERMRRDLDALKAQNKRHRADILVRVQRVSEMVEMAR